MYKNPKKATWHVYILQLSNHPYDGTCSHHCGHCPNTKKNAGDVATRIYLQSPFRFGLLQHAHISSQVILNTPQHRDIDWSTLRSISTIRSQFHHLAVCSYTAFSDWQSEAVRVLLNSFQRVGLVCMTSPVLKYLGA